MGTIRFFRSSVLVVFIFSCVSTWAQTTPPQKPQNVHCQVTNVSDRSFEEEHEFFFAEYPDIFYMYNSAEDQTFIVGPMLFNTTDKELPVEIDYSNEMDVVVIHVSPLQQGRRGDTTYTVAFTGNTGVFAYNNHLVADITCIPEQKSPAKK